MLKLVVKKGVSNISGTKKEYYRVGILHGTVVPLDKITKKIADNTQLAPVLVKAVIENMWPAIYDELEDGQSVQLGGITIQPSLTAKTHDDPKDCSADDVQRVRFVARTAGEFAKSRKSTTCSLLSHEVIDLDGDRDAQDEVITDNPAPTTGGDSPDNPGGDNPGGNDNPGGGDNGGDLGE